MKLARTPTIEELRATVAAQEQDLRRLLRSIAALVPAIDGLELAVDSDALDAIDACTRPTPHTRPAHFAIAV